MPMTLSDRLSQLEGATYRFVDELMQVTRLGQKSALAVMAKDWAVVNVQTMREIAEAIAQGKQPPLSSAAWDAPLAAERITEEIENARDLLTRALGSVSLLIGHVGSTYTIAHNIQKALAMLPERKL